MRKKKETVNLIIGILVVGVIVSCLVVSCLAKTGNVEEEPIVKSPEYYVETYGGTIEFHTYILSSTDCDFLEEKFGWAYQITRIHKGGTVFHKMGLGYMTSSSDKAELLKCVWWMD